MQRAPSLRLVVGDERRLCRESLRRAFLLQGSIEPVGEAADWHQTIEVVSALRPDVALISAALSGMSCVAGLERLAIRNSATKTILWCPDDDTLVVGALKAGAKGYLSRDADLSSCVRAFHAVHAGEVWVERRIMAQCLLQVNGAPAKQSAAGPHVGDLTERERAVLGLLVQGLSNKHIARTMCISDNTVKTHLNNIFRKLNFQRRSQAIVYALRNGLHEMEELRPHGARSPEVGRRP
jgi:DNA-binding NarL/FixJ family response regulator